jgi:hypothetical protein
MTQQQILTLCRRIFVVGVLACLILPETSCGNAQNGDAHQLTITSFSVSTDQTLTVPSNLVDLSDEHTTVFPLPNTSTYLVFGSSKISGGMGGTVVLETTDLQNFTFATGLGYNNQVMNPPVDFTSCNPAFDSEFDENYAAPGSVVQDPMQPPGNLIMFYEAENHCPGGTNQHSFYATVGFTRSSDGGKTWPQPVDSEFGGPDRQPVLKGPIPEPATNFNGAMGDAIPSAFVDSSHIYVTYSYHDAGQSSPQAIRVARASLVNNGQFQFLKWNNGTFSGPGIGGVDSPIIPVGGCAGEQGMPEVSFNDDLGLYMMIFVCNTGPQDGHAAWFYSTATSLDLQDWTPPQMILNSSYAVVSPCNIRAGTGTNFDGWYPSFMTPGSPAGHTRLTGQIFFMSGCDTGLPRTFASRTFTITAAPAR